MEVKPLFADGGQPRFLMARENRDRPPFEGEFLEVAPYTSAVGRTITTVKFRTKQAQEFLLATFSLRCKGDAPTGEAALRKPVRLTSDGTIWMVDFL